MLEEEGEVEVCVRLTGTFSVPPPTADIVLREDSATEGQGRD